MVGHRLSNATLRKSKRDSTPNWFVFASTLLDQIRRWPTRGSRPTLAGCPDYWCHTNDTLLLEVRDGGPRATAQTATRRWELCPFPSVVTCDLNGVLICQMFHGYC